MLHKENSNEVEQLMNLKIFGACVFWMVTKMCLHPWLIKCWHSVGEIRSWVLHIPNSPDVGILCFNLKRNMNHSWSIDSAYCFTKQKVRSKSRNWKSLDQTFYKIHGVRRKFKTIVKHNFFVAASGFNAWETVITGL